MEQLEQNIYTVQNFTGLDYDSAYKLLQIAGGNVELAVSLSFDDNANHTSGNEDLSTEYNDSCNNICSLWGPSYVCGLIVEKSSKVLSSSDIWLEQDLAFSDCINERCGLLQYKNGPCGILASINALLVVSRLKITGYLNIDKPFTEEEIVSVLANILLRCRDDKTDTHVKLCLWESTASVGKTIVKAIPCEKVKETIQENLTAFVGKGCLLLLIFSCIETREEKHIKNDILSSGGELPLIVGSNLLCTPELVMLLLSGRAISVIDEHSEIDNVINNVLDHVDVGIISTCEKLPRFSIHKTLKSTTRLAWILHSQDHFTMLFRSMNTSIDPQSNNLYYHYNGLPPGGPRMCRITIEVPNVELNIHNSDIYIKPIPGEIEDIVQAHPCDKDEYPTEWTCWKYECILAIDDQSVSGEERPSNLKPKIFSQGSEPAESNEWRCASCYRKRFSTMEFGQNQAGALSCMHCGLPRKIAGWSIWLTYEMLPNEWKRKMDERYSPPIIPLLQKAWPACTVTLLESSRKNEKGLPSV